MPAPGQAQRYYRSGQRWSSSYGAYTDYNRIPQQHRSQFRYDPRYRYVYRDQRVYVVDPTTQLIRQVLSGLS